MDHPRKGLINIQNIDDSECFKWSIVRYFSPVDHNPRRITKTDNDFAKKLDFKNIRDTHKIGIPSPLVFLVIKLKKKFHLCIKKM